MMVETWHSSVLVEVLGQVLNVCFRRKVASHESLHRLHEWTTCSSFKNFRAVALANIAVKDATRSVSKRPEEVGRVSVGLEIKPVSWTVPIAYEVAKVQVLMNAFDETDVRALRGEGVSKDVIEGVKAPLLELGRLDGKVVQLESMAKSANRPITSKSTASTHSLHG